jgi:membrane protease YdiL (CAAX protease family)
MTPELATLAPLLLPILAVCIMAWKRILRRAELQLPRSLQTSSWGFIEITITVGSYLLFTVGLLLSCRLLLGWEFDTSELDLTTRARTLYINGIAELTAVLVSTLFIAHGPLRLNPTPIGWTLSRALADIRLALLVAAAVLPVIYLVQFIVTQLPGMQYKHPFITMLLESDSPSLWIAVAVSAVVVAPIAEEYFFRALVQGWFESLLNAAIVNVRSPVTDIPCEDDATEPLIPASEEPDLGLLKYLPILLSATLFAAAHVGHGGGWVAIFVLALPLGCLYQKTRRLLPGIILHMLLNAISVGLAFIVSLNPPS